ncbi:MAG: class I SAM-dependent methyltransferase [Myxococcota bacterium]
MGQTDRTIRDFGEQWSHYASNEGYYGSLELFRDMLGPLLDTREFAGARVAEIGSGAGRIVRMLVECGAAHVLAVEPSDGVEALRANTRELADKVEILHASGESLPTDRGLDFVVSVGVIQFIVDPLPTLKAARSALRPGGRVFVWVYGLEGNRLYVSGVRALRAITTRLPHAVLDVLCGLLNGCVGLYIRACRWLPLPMRDYMRHTLRQVSPAIRRLTIYDQLNPTYARYYRGEELRSLLEEAGFRDVRLYHRRGYSWSATGEKPS